MSFRCLVVIIAMSTASASDVQNQTLRLGKQISLENVTDNFLITMSTSSNVENSTIPIREPDSEMRTTKKSEIFITDPDNLGDDSEMELGGHNFHPLWFLRPVAKKISDVISHLSHPNTALTPAHIVKKLRDKTLLVLKKVYKDICGDY